MSKSKLEREGRLPHCLGVQQETIYEALRYLDTKVDETTYEVILFYLGIKDEAVFHQLHLTTASTEATTEATTEAAAYIPARTEATTEERPA